MNATEEARAAAERYVEAWLANDLDAILDCYADEFSLHYFGDNPYSGDHVGKDAALAVLLEVGAKAPRSLLAVDDIMAGDGCATIVARETLSFEGASHEIRRVLRYHVLDSRFVDCWLYEENQQLVDAAWSS